MVDVDLSNHVILLVDDVAFARETMRRVLRSMNEPRIIDAADGAEAFMLLSKTREISFVIADFNMPVANGLQLLQAIRTGRAGTARSLPVAMLTGHTDQHLVASALALDVNAFAVKPISANTLSKRLRRMLDQARDTSWLKPVEAYQAVKFPVADKDRRGDALDRVLDVFDPAAKPSDDKGDSPPDARQTAVAETLLATSKVQEAERLAGELAGKLTRAGGKPVPEAVNEEIKEGVQNIVVDAGTGFAGSILTGLESLIAEGRLSTEEAAKVLAKEDESRPVARSPRDKGGGEPTVCTIDAIPENAIVCGDLYIAGSQKRVVSDGTPLSKQLLAAIRQLHSLGVLAPRERDGIALGPDEIFIRFDQAKSADGAAMEMIAPAQVQMGTVLANDIFLKDGRPYMLSGTEFTDRSSTLLQDLIELDRVNNAVWVQS